MLKFYRFNYFKPLQSMQYNYYCYYLKKKKLFNITEEKFHDNNALYYLL